MTVYQPYLAVELRTGVLRYEALPFLIDDDMRLLVRTVEDADLPAVLWDDGRWTRLSAADRKRIETENEISRDTLARLIDPDSLEPEIVTVPVAVRVIHWRLTAAVLAVAFAAALIAALVTAAVIVP